MGMTWRVRVRGLAIALGLLAALALASGADYVEYFCSLNW